jgi:hypothetical protein
MSAYTNLSIDPYSRDLKQRKEQRMMEAELAFWRNMTDELQAKLENIPQAIEKYGYIDVSYGAERMRLVVEKSDANEDERTP